MMPKSRKTLSNAVLPLPGQTWALHVYGPALRRNPDHLDDLIPVWAIHDPNDNYRSFFLVDGPAGMWAGRYDLERPLPAGIGGVVVAALYTDSRFSYFTEDAWNWVEGRPPVITIHDTMTKAELYKEVVRVYSRRNRG